MQLQITKPTELQSEISYEFFTDYADNYIEKLNLGVVLTEKRVRFSSSTVRQYKSAIFHFKSFESLLSGRVRTIEISGDLLKSFELYLVQSGKTKNSISNYLSKIKAISNILYEADISFKKVTYKTPKENTTQIYLSLSEITKMQDCQTLTEGQRKVLDIFIIQCFTSLRYSTLKTFLLNPIAYIKDHEGVSYIDIIASKTGEQCVIPLSEMVVSTLKKHNGQIKVPSERYTNETLKIIGKKAGIDNILPERITIGGKTEERLRPKYEKITTTSSRRTFLTLIKSFIPDNDVIICMSGHKNSQQMQHYVRSTKLDKIIPFMENKFFKISL